MERAPPSTGSRVGSRLRFPVVFLDRDGAALLLPGAAVRTRLFRHRLAIFICTKTAKCGSAVERREEDSPSGGLGGGGLGEPVGRTPEEPE